MELARGFDEYFRECLPRARGVASRLLSSGADVDDAVAEAFARALASWRKVEALDYRDAWVLRVTAHVAIDITRRRRPPDVPEGVEDMTNSTLDRIALAAALAALAPRQRDVITLHYLAGLSVEQVADALRLSVNTVKTHNARALEALRARLGSWEEQRDVQSV